MPDSKEAKRAAYMAVIEDVLAARDLMDEVRTRLNYVTADYGDPLKLHSILDGSEDDEEKDKPRPKRTSPRHSYTTLPLEQITKQLVIDNPGRTANQLVGAMRHLPLDQQFYETSMSPCLTELRRKGEIVGALCDTERKLKYYVMGAVPSTALVFDKDLTVSGMSHAAMKDAARKPTQREQGKGLEVVGPRKAS